MAESEQPKTNAGEPTFEASLTELQEVVRALEDGALGLDESIARFERGISLLRRCFQTLEQAEQKIELLTGFDRSGNPITAPFDGAATLDTSQAAPGKRSEKSKRKKPEPVPEPDASIPEADSSAAKEGGGGSSRPLF